MFKVSSFCVIRLPLATSAQKQKTTETLSIPKQTPQIRLRRAASVAPPQLNIDGEAPQAPRGWVYFPREVMMASATFLGASE